MPNYQITSNIQSQPNEIYFSDAGGEFKRVIVRNSSTNGTIYVSAYPVHRLAGPASNVPLAPGVGVVIESPSPIYSIRAYISSGTGSLDFGVIG